MQIVESVSGSPTQRESSPLCIPPSTCISRVPRSRSPNCRRFYRAQLRRTMGNGSRNSDRLSEDSLHVLRFGKLPDLSGQETPLAVAIAWILSAWTYHG